MKLPLAYYGDPILRKKCAPVEEINDEILQFIKDMEETMLAHDGWGLAAPQVHRSLAVFMICIGKQIGPDQWVPGKTRVFINPKIIECSKEEIVRGEGCLSIPGLYGDVYRPASVVIEATDVDGKRSVQEFKEMEARGIFHENDHINGVLYIDRIRGAEREELDAALRAIKKKYHK